MTESTPVTPRGSRHTVVIAALAAMIVAACVGRSVLAAGAQQAGTTGGAWIANVDAWLAEAEREPRKAMATGPQVLRSLPEDVRSESFDAYAARITAAAALSSVIAKHLREARSQAAASFANELLSEEYGKSPTPPPRRPRAGYLYRRYLPDFAKPIDEADMPPRARRFIATYYELCIQTRERDLIALGTPDLYAREENAELYLYLFLLPLLHKSDQVFAADDLGVLPAWARTRKALQCAFDFSVWQLSRPRTALCLAKLMVGPGRRDRDVVEILTDTGRLAVERRRLRLGVELYALAVQKAGPRTPQADRLRVEIIRRLESVRAWPLLAEQCDVCLDDLGDVSDADRAFVVATRLRALAEVDATTSLATAIDRALADGRLASRRADLLLLKWRHLRKEGKGQAAAKVLKAFLEEYPNDPRAAELFYAVAVDCLASEQYEEARSILRTLRERFPHAAQAEWAETLLGRLSRIHTSARAPTTNAK